MPESTGPIINVYSLEDLEAGDGSTVNLTENVDGGGQEFEFGGGNW